MISKFLLELTFYGFSTPELQSIALLSVLVLSLLALKILLNNVGKREIKISLASHGIFSPRLSSFISSLLLSIPFPSFPFLPFYEKIHCLLGQTLGLH